MLKIKAYASSRPTTQNKNGKTAKDGWGFDRQTVYLKKSAHQSFQDEEYRNIANYQREFCNVLERILQEEPNYFPNKLEKIYNDPTAYSVTEIIEDIREHYNKRHDPTLSMILRQRYIIGKLAEQLDNPSIVRDWSIDIQFVNPSTPVLRKFFDKGVFDQAETNTYSKLFNH